MTDLVAVFLFGMAFGALAFAWAYDCEGRV